MERKRKKAKNTKERGGEVDRNSEDEVEEEANRSSDFRKSATKTEKENTKRERKRKKRKRERQTQRPRGQGFKQARRPRKALQQRERKERKKKKKEEEMKENPRSVSQETGHTLLLASWFLCVPSVLALVISSLEFFWNRESEVFHF